MALEVGRSDRHGRPTCSECTDQLRKRRGCRSPHHEPRELAGSPFAFTAPALQGLVLRECPVGYLLREAPHVYDVIEFCRMGEHTSALDLASLPRYTRRAMRIYSSECARLDELRRATKDLAGDAAHAAGMVR
jgi:hypothetical protein